MLDFSTDVDHKRGRLLKVLLKKGLKFVLDKRGGIVAFNLSLMLLSAEVDLISKNQIRESIALGVYYIDYIQKVFVRLTKVITFYVRATIIQVGVLGLESLILECKICFAIFLAINKQF